MLVRPINATYRRNLRHLLGIVALSTTALSCQSVATPPPSAPASFEPITSAAPVRAESGIVVSSSARASQVGRSVLQAGGNAVDAAIATGFAMAVTHPSAGNIGGGGFMVIRFPDGSSTSFDFREKAPLAAHPEMFLDDDGEYSRTIHHNSHMAVGVPGTVAGFAAAHDSYGVAPWDELVAPALGLAERGFVLTATLAGSIARTAGRYPQYPATVAALTRDGMPYQAGEVWRQPDLARSLERIMQDGRDGFYRGETARLIVAEMRRGGGLITEEDLARTLERIMHEGHQGFYAGETARLIAEEMERGGGLITAEDLARYEAKERVPISGSYRDYEIISMPPPSSGGTAVVQMLNILEGFDLRSMGHNSAEYIHHLTEAMRLAFRDRARFLGDADFVEVPLERLTSKEYARELRASIDPSWAGASAPSDVELPYESEETTHYSVVDADGMAVSVTYTLEQGFGSKIVVPGAGFFLNNEMGDFNASPGLTTETSLIGTDANLARPEQRMLSSMTPSIVAHEGELVAVLGSPGGRTIINTVLQVILNIVDFEMGIQEAVDTHRFHHQWLPDVIRIEDGGVTQATVDRVESMGHTVGRTSSQGAANAIQIDRESGDRLGAPDRRRSDGGAAGH